jgi:hypothetical protein
VSKFHRFVARTLGVTIFAGLVLCLAVSARATDSSTLGTDRRHAPAVAAGGGRLFYAWPESNGRLYGRFVDAATGATVGTKLVLANFGSGVPVHSPEVVYIPTTNKFMVFFVVSTSTTETSLMGLIINGSDQTVGYPFEVYSYAGAQSDPSAVWVSSQQAVFVAYSNKVGPFGDPSLLGEMVQPNGLQTDMWGAPELFPGQLVALADVAYSPGQNRIAIVYSRGSSERIDFTVASASNLSFSTPAQLVFPTYDTASITYANGTFAVALVNGDLSGGPVVGAATFPDTCATAGACNVTSPGNIVVVSTNGSDRVGQAAIVPRGNSFVIAYTWHKAAGSVEYLRTVEINNQAVVTRASVTAFFFVGLPGYISNRVNSLVAFDANKVNLAVSHWFTGNPPTTFLQVSGYWINGVGTGVGMFAGI